MSGNTHCKQTYSIYYITVQILRRVRLFVLEFASNSGRQNIHDKWQVVSLPRNDLNTRRFIDLEDRACLVPTRPKRSPISQHFC